VLRTCCDYLLLLLSFVIAGLSYGSMLILPVFACCCMFIKAYADDGSTYGGVLESDDSIISILLSFSSVIS